MSKDHPILAKIWTLWTIISRTEKDFDMRFSRGAQNWLVLHSEQVASKSSSGCQHIEHRSSKNCMKIGRFLGKITPWRRQVGKNLMRRTGKRIYRRFWISNQIFDSIYGSRDIAHSLDTTFGNLGQNLNFVDDYLKNGKRFWHAVFARCSELISSTFWASFIKIVRAISEKKSKNCHFDHIFGFFGWSDPKFFFG